MQQGRESASAEWRQHWPLVAAAMSGVALATVSQASTGVMMEPLEAEFGWSRAQISLGAGAVAYTTLFLSALAGLAVDRLGARRIGLIAATLLCLAIAAMASLENRLWQWFGLWIMVGVASAAMPTVWLAGVSRVFSAGRGMAVAVVLSGSGISTFLVPVIGNMLVEHYGWRTGYLGLAAIWAAVSLPLIALFYRPPENVRSAAQAGAAPGLQAKALTGLSVGEGLRAPAFWKLGLAAFLSTVGGVALILNLMPVLTYTGLPRATAAAVAGLVGLATIAGRICGGWLMDRINAKYIAAFSTLVATTLPILLLTAPGSVALATTGVVIYGLMGGAKIGAIAYLSSRHMGAKAFGTLYGAINSMLALAVGTAPVLANLVYDRTQSYEPVMWAAIPVMALAALVYLSLGTYPDFDQAARQDQPETGER